jgi:hypothetical protein
MEDYLRVFQDKLDEYSPGKAIRLNYSAEQGMHMIANRKIYYKESEVDLPCRYAISVRKCYYTSLK